MPDEPQKGDRSEKGPIVPDKVEKGSPIDERSYYYDDAHGYEDFDPDEEDDTDNQED